MLFVLTERSVGFIARIIHQLDIVIITSQNLTLMGLVGHSPGKRDNKYYELCTITVLGLNSSGSRGPPTPVKTSQKEDGHHVARQVIGPPLDKFLDLLLNNCTSIGFNFLIQYCFQWFFRSLQHIPKTQISTNVQFYGFIMARKDTN